MSGVDDDVRGYRVHGRVQGVGFRFWARLLAGSFRVRGTVRNLPDGSVEIVAVGSPAALATFEDALTKGPTRGRVESVERWQPPAASYQGFEIIG